MLQHRVVCGKIDFARYADAFRLGLRAVKLDAVLKHHALAAFELPKKIKVPPRAAKLSIGRKLEAQVRLLADDLPDLLVFDRLQPVRRNLALCALDAGLLQRGAAQQAADRVGTEGWTAVGHGRYSLFALLPSITATARR